MIWPEPPRHRPSLIEALLGYLLALIALTLAFGFFIELLVPLLPWVGLFVLISIAARVWWLWRYRSW